MDCPYCLRNSTRVLDSRLNSEIGVVRRKRECLDYQCKGRFSTIEQVEFELPNVSKSNGTIEKFNQTKFMSGIQRSFKKTSITSNELSGIVIRVMLIFSHKNLTTISSDNIAEAVMAELKK